MRQRPVSWIFPASLLFLCLVGVRFAAPARAAEPEWSAGVASVKITPPKPVALAGYASRTKPFEKVDQDLYARALALKDDKGHQAVLVTLDICILPADVAEPVRARIAERGKLVGLAAVILSVSHTHSGPAVSLNPDATAAGVVNPNSAGTIEYSRWLQERLVEAADKALADLQPATLAWGGGIAHFAMNRREFTDKGVILGVNPRGPVDRTVPVLRVDGPDGKPRVLLFGYACHGTTNPPSHMGVSPDYPGFARAVVEERFPGATAMFIAGCGGDANPYPRLKLEDAAANGNELGKEVCRVAEGGKLKPIHGPLSCAVVTAQLPLETPDRAALEKIVQIGPASKKEDAKQMLAVLERGERLPAAHPAPVAAWQFGQEMTLIALPDEVVSEYVPLIEQKLGPLRLWIAGYCHEVIGYVPTRNILTQGGYETRGLYVGSGWFTPEVQETLLDAAASAASSAGRKMTTKGL
jgi:neutral ceramidase